jgi:hypothetical protein
MRCRGRGQSQFALERHQTYAETVCGLDGIEMRARTWYVHVQWYL